MLVSICDRIAGLSGKSRASLAFLLGVTISFAQPPYGFIPVLLAFAILLWQIDGTKTPKEAAWLGWFSGLGFFISGLYWISEAFQVQADIFGWMAPFAVIFMAAFLSLFWAFSFSAARFLHPKGGYRAITFAAIFILAEFLRGNILTGFPWALQAYVWTGFYPAQFAAFIGPYGLSFLTVVTFTVFGAILPSAPRAAKISLRWPLGGALLITLMALGGYARYNNVDPLQNARPNLRIVQPNIPQSEKWKDTRREEFLLKTLKLTKKEYQEPPQIVIWPETAVPFLLDRDGGVRLLISESLPDGSELFTGSQRVDVTDKGNDWYNSFMVINDKGKVTQTYDKHHLVPFGEFLPLQSLLEKIGLRQLTQLRGGFSAGKGPMTLHSENAPAFSPLICYEIIFPEEIGDNIRPLWLLNLTNDAWFGTSVGPEQHLAQAQFRAIENGVPVIRAANTGISAVIDSYGHILKRIDLEKEGVIDDILPPALPITLYQMTGDMPVILLLTLIILAQWVKTRRSI